MTLFYLLCHMNAATVNIGTKFMLNMLHALMDAHISDVAVFSFFVVVK